MTLTQSEIEALWSIAGKIGAAIVALGGFVKMAQYLFSITPTSRLGVRVKKCEMLLEKDYQHLQQIDSDIKDIRKEHEADRAELRNAVKGINKLGTSQISLLHHMIDGNGIEEMKKEADDLTKFFVEEQ